MTESISTKKKVLFWLIATGVIIGLFVLLSGILLPFVASLVLAYFFDPVVEKLESKGFSRSISTLLLLTGFLLIAIIGLIVLIPIVQHQIAIFAEKLPIYTSNLWAWAESHFNKLDAIITPEQVVNIKSSILSYIGDAAGLIIPVFKTILSGGVVFFNIVALIIITPVVSFYILRDWKGIKTFFQSIVPAYFKKSVNEQIGEINTILSGFIRGQATVCLCLAIFYSIGLTLAGLDTGVVIGIMTGTLSFIPYVGVWSGFIVSILLGAAQFSDPTNLLWIVAVFAIGQVLEGYILTPNLVGNKTRLHPVWIIFALLAGAYLFGFLGVLVAVPVAAVIGVLVRFSLKKYHQSAFYIGLSTKQTSPKSKTKIKK